MTAKMAQNIKKDPDEGCGSLSHPAESLGKAGGEYLH